MMNPLQAIDSWSIWCEVGIVSDQTSFIINNNHPIFHLCLSSQPFKGTASGYMSGFCVNPMSGFCDNPMSGVTLDQPIQLARAWQISGNVTTFTTACRSRTVTSMFPLKKLEGSARLTRSLNNCSGIGPRLQCGRKNTCGVYPPQHPASTFISTFSSPASKVPVCARTCI